MSRIIKRETADDNSGNKNIIFWQWREWSAPDVYFHSLSISPPKDPTNGCWTINCMCMSKPYPEHGTYAETIIEANPRESAGDVCRVYREVRRLCVTTASVWGFKGSRGQGPNRGRLLPSRNRTAGWQTALRILLTRISMLPCATRLDVDHTPVTASWK